MAITTDYIKIHVDEKGRLIIRKRKLIKYGSIAISFILPLLLTLGPIIYLLWEYKSKQQLSTPLVVITIVMIAFGLWMTWLSTKTAVVGSNTIALSITGDNVYINDVYFCRKADLESTTTQTIPDRAPEKFSYNIGIVAGKKFAPLLFSKTFTKAKAAENIIAHYLAGENIEEDLQPFMSLKV